MPQQFLPLRSSNNSKWYKAIRRQPGLPKKRLNMEYAEAKTAYFKALREEMPELTNIATDRQARPPELDKFATAFALAGEKQEMVADQKTMIFLERFSGNPEVEKAEAEFERAQKVEEAFHTDFDGIDFSDSFLWRGESGTLSPQRWARV
jgi:hypothetical protein